MPVDAVTHALGVREIANRTRYYPEVGALLRSGRIHVRELERSLRQCWALLYRYDAVHLSQFLDSGKAKAAISRLVDSFPRSHSGVAARIDSFVERATALGFSKPDGKPDRSGGALLASVLLTAAYPDRFVDYRQVRWAELADVLEYELPKAESYGERLLSAGRFARHIAETKTFQRYWPDQEPLWALSGIAWMGPRPDRPGKVVEFDDGDEGFPEGRLKEILHVMHERNRVVVKRAKELAWQLDPSLPCEVCGFSFVRAYGPLGERLIEAHHRRPVATLKRGNTTKVEEIALVCANCHRMLHRGGKTLSLDKLKEML